MGLRGLSTLAMTRLFDSLIASGPFKRLRQITAPILHVLFAQKDFLLSCLIVTLSRESRKLANSHNISKTWEIYSSMRPTYLSLAHPVHLHLPLHPLCEHIALRLWREFGLLRSFPPIRLRQGLRTPRAEVASITNSRGGDKYGVAARNSSGKGQ